MNEDMATDVFESARIWTSRQPIYEPGWSWQVKLVLCLIGIVVVIALAL